MVVGSVMSVFICYNKIDGDGVVYNYTLWKKNIDHYKYTNKVRVASATRL